MKRMLLFLLITATRLIAYTQAAKDPVLVTDLLKLKTVGSLTATSDGSKTAFTVTSIEADEKSKLDYKYNTQLYTVDAMAGAQPKQLTFSKESSLMPAWSPDGKSLAFVRNADGKPQVFLLNMNGGEGYQLTRYKYGATNPKWSADGKRIYFFASVSYRDLLKDSLLNPGNRDAYWPSEKPGITSADLLKSAKAKSNPDGALDEIRAYLTQDETDGKAIVLNKLNFQDEMNVSAAMNFTQVVSIAIDSPLNPVLVAGGYFRASALEILPDGRLIVTANSDSTQHPDRTQESEIYISTNKSSTFDKLAGRKGWSYNSAKPSPSGKWLAYQSAPVNGDIATLLIMPLNGTEKDAIRFPFDRAKSSFMWSSDERYLYFTAQSNGGVPLYRLNTLTKKIEQLSGYDAGISSYTLAKDKIVFAKTEVLNPSDLFIADAVLKKITPISHFNSWVSTKLLSVPEKKTFLNSKGQTIEYWMMKPADYTSSKKYPLLLEIHGGPTAMWGPGEASMWHEFQYFASKGYGIVYCNPRGSGGYGDDFIRANISDWGTGPSLDVLTALDKTVAEGWADTSNLFITGGSYAGYLVAWIIAHDKRFKAACSQRGVYDLATFFGEGNAWRLVPRYFGGYPWEAATKALLQRESPINYVQHITTPYIIFHGDNDRRTGFVQSEMMYRSLKILNRPVEYVRHPGATHEITRTGDNRQRIDQLLRTYEFFERWKE